MNDDIVDDCRTLTLYLRCWRHREPPAPPGVWAEAVLIMDEQNDEQQKGNHER